MLPARMILLGLLSPASPSFVCRGLHVFSPLDGICLAFASGTRRAGEGTRWGVNGDSDASGSARQQQTFRRSTGLPRAGSDGEGSLATGQSARADKRIPAPAPARPSQAQAGRANRRPRTRAPHGEERSEKTGGRASARTASDRDREHPVSAVDDRE
jgi:hypothetical protein